MKAFGKILIFLNILILLVILIAASIWYQSLTKDAASTPITRSTTDTLFHFPISPIYLQNDPRWKDDKMGGSQETLGEAGCFVACVSMALAHHGIDLTPKRLNELLKTNDGYTKQGWVRWYTVSKITNQQIRFYAPSQPSSAVIDAALKSGAPILAKILLYNVMPHWVLIVGKEGQDYLVKDPLGDGKSLDKLSKFKNKIYAIRVVNKME